MLFDIFVLCTQYNDNLQGLNLAHNDIGDLGAAALATALQKYDKLKVLDLQDNQIGDAGAKVNCHYVDNVELNMF
jgi:Ran GTPase-activating protein (RanGAP) involved in mRNA processing and transport